MRSYLTPQQIRDNTTRGFAGRYKQELQSVKETNAHFRCYAARAGQSALPRAKSIRRATKGTSRKNKERKRTADTDEEDKEVVEEEDDDEVEERFSTFKLVQQLPRVADRKNNGEGPAPREAPSEENGAGSEEGGVRVDDGGVDEFETATTDWDIDGGVKTPIRLSTMKLTPCSIKTIGLALRGS